MPRTMYYECTCMTLSIMSIVSKAAVVTVQSNGHMTQNEVYIRLAPTGDRLFDTASYAHTYTKQSIGKSKSISKIDG
jgi:hypothetical protein